MPSESRPRPPAVTAVSIAPLPIERFREVLDGPAFADLVTLRDEARLLLHNRVVWCVNSTARGGGVAEMLRSLLAFTRGAGVDTRWMVVGGTPAFFTLTKRLHNRLHESVGDGGALGPAERAVYDGVCGAAGRELAALVSPGDVVILHDPQTAGLAAPLTAAGAGVVWRSHIGVDHPGPLAAEAAAFLAPFLAAVDTYVFSRQSFVWPALDPARVTIIPPSIDVFATKNQQLGTGAARAILRTIGLREGAAENEAPAFAREDGTPGRVDRVAAIVQDAPLAPDVRYVAQVSRWDRLKDPVGVVRGWAARVAPFDPAHLVLAGPATDGVADDPEGVAVLAEVVAARAMLDAETRGRVHLVSLPMVDAEENAAMVNAIQVGAAVVVQKSLAEGFGLTVAEAMWKRRPVVAGAVGGIQDQVVDGESGLLVDPADLRAFGDAVARLLADDPFSARLGAAGRARIQAGFLEPRHLAQWLAVVRSLPVPASVDVGNHGSRRGRAPMAAPSDTGRLRVHHVAHPQQRS